MEKTLWFVIVGIVSGFLAERLMKGRGFGPHNGSIKYYARTAVVWFFGPFSKKRHFKFTHNSLGSSSNPVVHY